MLSISIVAEKIGSLFGFPITNSLVATWVVMAVLFIFTWAATRKLTLVPSGIQSIAEVVVDGIYNFFATVSGKNIDMFFPLGATLFLFIIISNWMGLLPGFSTIGFYHGKEFVPLLRAATSDLNMTIALALVSVVSIEYFGFSRLGFRYGKKFLNLKNPLAFYIGIVDLISELSRIISFAFRLFGNIFAGEVLLAVTAFFLPFLVPLPFLTLELFVGFIQALVFSMLTVIFLNIAVSHTE